MSRFTTELACIRERLGCTKKEMARRMGVSYTWYRYIEHERRRPSVNFVNCLTQLLRCSRTEHKMWHQLAADACGWDVLGVITVSRRSLGI